MATLDRPYPCAMLSAALIVCVVFPVAGKFTPAQLRSISKGLDRTVDKVKPEINQLLVDMGALPALEPGETAPPPSQAVLEPCKALQNLMHLENSLKIVEHDARTTIFKVRYQMTKDANIMETQEMGPLVMAMHTAAIQLETSVTNCQTAINQNKDRCQAEYKAEAKAEAEAKAKANGMTKAQVIANAKAKAEAKAEAKAKAKAEAKVEDKAEAKVENKAETKVESNESNNGKATRILAPKIFPDAFSLRGHGPGVAQGKTDGR